MKSWAIVLSGMALHAAWCSPAAAQAGIGNVFGVPTGLFESAPQPREAKAFGEDLKQLPGQGITAINVKGKWSYRQLKRNAEIDGVRVPQQFTSLLLDLQADGTYTIEYTVYWGAASGAPEAQHAGLQVNEKGKFSVSGGILLLEATASEVSKQTKTGRTTQTPKDLRRPYLARLEKGYLNIAGACASYQAEEVCTRHRNVWFPLAKLQSTVSLGR